MSQGVKDRKYVSLAVKNAAFYIALILLSSLLIGYIIYRLSYNIVLKSSEQNALHTLEILELKLKSSIDNARKDVLFIARSPYLKDYIGSVNGSLEERKKLGLVADYITFLSSRPDYSQIRYIGKQQNGKEVLRVDRMNDTITVISNQELQEKGNTAYFKETIDLPEDSVSFSIIDLNKEHGKVSFPKMATLRASCPVWFNDISHGIAVINVNLNSLIRELSNISKEEFEIHLVNSFGRSLIHPNPDRSFSFEFGDTISILNDLGIQKLPEDNSILVKNDKLATYARKVNYPKKNYSLYFIVQSKENKLLASFVNWRWSIVGITLMVASLFMLLALWWLRRQSRDMDNIVHSISLFEKNLKTSDLPIERNDEIGIIAKSFDNMANVINSNIDKLTKAKKLAEDANVQKEEFLQNMSHEIRNPLHTIIGMIRMLEDNKPNKEQLPMIESLKFSSNTLLSLVNDVLDFSKLKEGKISLNPEPCNVNTLSQQIIKSFAFDAQNKKIKINYNCEAVLLNKIYFIDKLRLSQILVNLLSNAIKFTPSEGEVNVRIQEVKQKDENSELLFLVSDSGPGIPIDKFSTIVSRFEKLDKNNSIDQYGAGLGLPIVVQLLTLFNSRLELNGSTRGAQFSFQIRVPIVLEGRLESKNLVPKHNYQNITVIDDDPQILYWYKHIFAENEYKLKCIECVEDLKNVKLGAKADIIISDNQLNEVSILDHLLELSELIADSGVKVMLTGNHDIAIPLLASDGFFDIVLQKPVEAQALKVVISKIWNYKSVGVADFRPIFRDYDSDKSKILNFYNILIEEWESCVLQLEDAIRNKNNESKNKVVHKMANSLRKFKLEDLENYWKDIDLTSDLDTDKLRQSILRIKNSIELTRIHQSILST